MCKPKSEAQAITEWMLSVYPATQTKTDARHRGVHRNGTIRAVRGAQYASVSPMPAVAYRRPAPSRQQPHVSVEPHSVEPQLAEQHTRVDSYVCGTCAHRNTLRVTGSLCGCR